MAWLPGWLRCHHRQSDPRLRTALLSPIHGSKQPMVPNYLRHLRSDSRRSLQWTALEAISRAGGNYGRNTLGKLGGIRDCALGHIAHRHRSRGTVDFQQRRGLGLRRWSNTDWGLDGVQWSAWVSIAGTAEMKVNTDSFRLHGKLRQCRPYEYAPLTYRMRLWLTHLQLKTRKMLPTRSRGVSSYRTSSTQ